MQRMTSEIQIDNSETRAMEMICESSSNVDFDGVYKIKITNQLSAVDGKSQEMSDMINLAEIPCELFGKSPDSDE